jgi:hypothetical protein
LKSKSLKDHSGGFWENKSIEQIIAEQGVKPFNWEKMFGKWPKEHLDDGFEEALARWRKEGRRRTSRRRR